MFGDIDEENWKSILLPYAHTSVLDMGCGYGRISKILTDLHCTVHAWDREPKFIELTKHQCPNAHMKEVDLMTYSLPSSASDDETYDVIIISCVCNYLPQSKCHEILHWCKSHCKILLFADVYPILNSYNEIPDESGFYSREQNTFTDDLTEDALLEEHIVRDITIDYHKLKYVRMTYRFTTHES